MNTLALDIATKCGWCVYYDGHWSSGVWNMTKRAKQTSFTRLSILRDRLNETLVTFPSIECVAWEQVNFAKFTQAHAVWNQLFGVTQLWCLDNKIELLMPVNTLQLKKYATGSGKSDKQEMVNAVNRLFTGVNITDDNEADARLICRWAVDSIEVK